MLRFKLVRFVTAVSVSALLVLFYIILFDSTTVKPAKPLRGFRWLAKARAEYPILEGSAVESQFMTLKIHNCSGTVLEPQLKLNNRYWQVVDDGKVFLYSGFYDSRFVYLKVKYHYVRIIGMAVGKIGSRKYYCSLWYKQLPNLITVEAEAQEIWLQQWNPNPEPGMYHTYLFTCPIPLNIKDKGIMPSYVSLSSEVCKNFTTKLSVVGVNSNVFKNRERKNFVVCVKGMDFAKDLSVMLVEWLELLFILGADKVMFYKYRLHVNIERVLEYYKKQKKVEVVPLTLPGDQPNSPDLRTSYLKKQVWQKRRNELVPYNDCLYKNMYDYEYIIPLDIDEVIMPLKSFTWSSMLNHFKEENPKWFKKYPSFSAQNTYFLDVYNSSSNPQIPPYYRMLQSKLRSANYSYYGHSVKSFVSTSLSKFVFNHYTLESLYAVRKTNLVMNTSYVQLNHYKERCPREIYSQCQKKFLVHIKRDDAIDRYKDKLVNNVEYVIKKLNLLS